MKIFPATVAALSLARVTSPNTTIGSICKKTTPASPITNTAGLSLREAPATTERLPYISLLGLYKNESPLNEQGKIIHQQNAAQTYQNIERLLNKHGAFLSADTIYKIISDNVITLFKNFNASPYQAYNAHDEHGYSKTLLLSYSNAAIQVFVFTGQQQTPVHSHPDSCKSLTLRVENGTLSEDLYYSAEPQSTPKFKAGHVRTPGSTGVVGPEDKVFNLESLHENDLHRLKFECHDPDGHCLAVHIHTYKNIDGISADQQASVKNIYPQAA